MPLKILWPLLIVSVSVGCASPIAPSVERSCFVMAGSVERTNPDGSHGTYGGVVTPAPCRAVPRGSVFTTQQ